MYKIIMQTLELNGVKKGKPVVRGSFYEFEKAQDVHEELCREYEKISSHQKHDRSVSSRPKYLQSIDIYDADKNKYIVFREIAMYA